MLRLDGVQHFFGIDSVSALGDLLRATFVDLVANDSAVTADTTYRIDEDGEGGYTVEVDGAFSFSETLAGDVVAGLVSNMNRAIAGRNDGRLALHAALLVKDDAGLIVVGESWSGKSTLAAALTKSGWSYGGDEVVRVDPSGSMVLGFPKPISLKRGSRALFPDLPPLPAADRGTTGPNGEALREHLPGSSLGAVSYDIVVPRLVAMLEPRLPNKAVTRSEPFEMLEPATAVVGLVNNSFEHQSSSQDQILTAARLASRCRVASVPAGELCATLAVIEELWDRSHTPFPVEALPWKGSSDVAGVLAGDAAIIGVDGRLLAIDPMPSGLWEAIESGADEARITEIVADRHGVAIEDVAKGLRPVIDELRQAGLIRLPGRGSQAAPDDEAS